MNIIDTLEQLANTVHYNHKAKVINLHPEEIRIALSHNFSENIQGLAWQKTYFPHECDVFS